MKRALILGVGGQDGSYLAELLLREGYEVHGLVRRSSADNLWRLREAGIIGKVKLHHGDLLDMASLANSLNQSDPDEIYNEADQDKPLWSNEAPGYQVDVGVRAVVNLLELVIPLYDCKIVKVFQPLSVTMFGGNPPSVKEPQFDPQSAYAVAKIAAWQACRFYRAKHKMHVSCGIMGNHVSERREKAVEESEYLLPKICRAVVRGDEATLNELRQADFSIDIGHAEDYMRAAHSILQRDEPGDHLLLTGKSWPVGELVECAVAFHEVRWHVDRGLLRRWVGEASPSCFTEPRWPMSGIIDSLLDRAKKEQERR